MTQLTDPTVILSYNTSTLKKTEQAKPKFLSYVILYTVNNMPSQRNKPILENFYTISNIFHETLHLHHYYLAE